MTPFVAFFCFERPIGATEIARDVSSKLHFVELIILV